MKIELYSDIYNWMKKYLFFTKAITAEIGSGFEYSLETVTLLKSELTKRNTQNKSNTKNMI